MTFGVAVAALVYLSVVEAGGFSRLSWIQMQTEERRAAAGSSEIRYLCTENMAFDLGADGKPLVLGENRIVITEAEIANRCLLPEIPLWDGAQMTLSATAPASGWGAMLVDFDETPADVLDEMNRAFIQVGWRETGASKIANQNNRTLPARAYERDRAWMMIVAVQHSDANRTTVLFAGRYASELMEQ